jgi:hypothetical protein
VNRRNYRIIAHSRQLPIDEIDQVGLGLATSLSGFSSPQIFGMAQNFGLEPGAGPLIRSSRVHGRFLVRLSDVLLVAGASAGGSR